MSILVNKAYPQYDFLSRYTPFPFYYHTKDNRYISGTTAYLKNDTVYTLYTVKKNDTFDSLALEFYNNPTLYWVICSFNHIQDPYEEPTEGTTLMIPSLSNIEFDI